MTRDRMFTELRSRLSDDVAPYKWSDDFLLSALAEGQDKFCEETGYFTDFSNFTVTLETGVAVYAIPERVIEILDIWDGTRRLGKYQESDRGIVPQAWDILDTGTQTGRPRAWQTDQSTGSITFDRTPTAAENDVALQLRVWRYSLKPLDRLTSTVTLAGALHASDVIAATVNGSVYSYVALGTEGTLTAVATALAAVIDAATDLVASASGQVVSVAAVDPSTSTSASVAVSGVGATITATAADVYSAEPEIPSRFHRAPIEWAAHKAYTDHDAEKADKIKAETHELNFLRYCRDGKRALQRIQGHSVRVGTAPAYRT